MLEKASDSWTKTAQKVGASSLTWGAVCTPWREKMNCIGTGCCCMDCWSQPSSLQGKEKWVCIGETGLQVTSGASETFVMAESKLLPWTIPCRSKYLLFFSVGWGVVPPLESLVCVKDYNLSLCGWWMQQKRNNDACLSWKSQHSSQIHWYVFWSSYKSLNYI